MICNPDHILGQGRGLNFFICPILRETGMFLKKLMASWRAFCSGSRSRDDGEHGRLIVERLLEMSKHHPVGTSPGTDDAGERRERKGA